MTILLDHIIGFLVRKPRHVRTYYNKPLFIVSLTQFFWSSFSPIALTKGRRTFTSVSLEIWIYLDVNFALLEKSDFKQVVVMLGLYLPCQRYHPIDCCM